MRCQIAKRVRRYLFQCRNLFLGVSVNLDKVVGLVFVAPRYDVAYPIQYVTDGRVQETECQHVDVERGLAATQRLCQWVAVEEQPE